jgi:hypothetical protein
VLLGFYWIGAKFLMSFFLLSDSHSQPRAKINLKDHSSATFAEKFFLEKLTFDHMFRCIARQNLLSVTFAEKKLSQRLISVVFKLCAAALRGAVRNSKGAANFFR